MNESKSTYWLPIAIIAAFLAVCIFGIVTYVNTLAIRDSEQQVSRSYAIREATQQLLSAMKDIETGQRGFLLTGNEGFLQPYQLGYQEAESHFERLKSLASADEQLQQHVQELRDTFEQQQSHFAQTIELRRSEPATRVSDEVLELVKSGRGKAAMEKARRVAADIVAGESKRLEESEATTSYLSTVSQTTITVGHFIALALILTAGVAAWLDRRKRDGAETALIKEQMKLAAVIESAFEGITTYGDDFLIRFMNPAAANIFGVNREEVQGRSILDFVPQRMLGHFAERCETPDTMPEDLSPAAKIQRAKQTLASLATVESGPLVFPREFTGQPMLRSNGTEFPSDGTATRTVAEDDRFTTVRFRDLTDSQTNQANLREYTAILGQINDAVLVCDLDGHIRSCNDSAEELLCATENEIVGQSARELLKVDADKWESERLELLATGTVNTQRSWIAGDGRQYILEQRRSLIRDEDGTPTGKMLFLIDITDRVREEANERRAQRLESIGTLAGGIAHDLNNVLTPILMSAKLIKRGGSKTPERLVDNIITSADRGAKLIKKLLSFAGGDEGTRTQADLREILAELEEILSHTLNKTIDLQVKFPEKLQTIQADGTEISQVIMNLAINARDALPSGGRIEIEVENVTVDESRASRSNQLTAGSHVLLTVTDNGEGIPKEIIDRIFDPFFTTKDQGRGTGLGLATTLGIVRSYGGDISVDSEPGVGTKFSIYLPSSELSAERAEISEDDDDVPYGKGEMILIVDDEPLILDTAREVLESNHYKVIAASSGTEALAVYQHQGESISLVLLDMMMPGMDGFEAKNAMRSINAGVKVLASSGLRRPRHEGVKMKDFDGFLSKPYSDAKLLRAIRNVIDQPIHS